MSGSRYAIGIDLGTTHSALACVDLAASDGDGSGGEVMAVPQLTAPGAVEAQPLLPSFLYLPHADELAPGELALPWSAEGQRRGRRAGAQPRCDDADPPGVQRQELAVPPRRRPPRRRSCRTTRRPRWRASRRWRSRCATWSTCARPGTTRIPTRRSPSRSVTVTVPASFDPAARELTVEAARAAGCGELTLLEEPQAALYSWIQASRRRLAQAGAAGRHPAGRRRRRRHHRLLAHRRARARGQPRAAPRRRRRPHPARRRQHGPGAGPCGRAQARRRRHDARRLADARADLRLPQRQGAPARRRRRGPRRRAHRGARPRQQAHRRLDPHRADARRGQRRPCSTASSRRWTPSARPLSRARAGLAQLGLPYAQDAGGHAPPGRLPRPAARAPSPSWRASPTSWRRARASCTRPRCSSTAASSSPAALAERTLATLNALAGGRRRRAGARCWPAPTWTSRWPAAPPTTATCAAARACASAAAPRFAYYVGVESAMPAVPGIEPPVQALCVAPFGMEEGTEADVPDAGVRPGGRRAGALPLLRLVGAPAGRRRHPARRLEPATNCRSWTRSRPPCPPRAAAPATWCRCACTPASPRPARWSSRPCR